MLNRPHNHIRDFFVKTPISKDCKSAAIEMAAEYLLDVMPGKVSLFDLEDNLIFTAEECLKHLVISVENPKLWNAENPVLHEYSRNKALMRRDEINV